MTRIGVLPIVGVVCLGGATAFAQTGSAPKPVLDEPPLNLPSVTGRAGTRDNYRGVVRHSVAATGAPARTVVVPPGEQVVLTPVYPVHYPVPIYITPPLHGTYVPPFYLPPAHYYAYPTGHVPVAAASAGAVSSASADSIGTEPERRTTVRETTVQETVEK